MTRKCQCGCRQPATGGNGVSAWASLDCAVKIAQERQRKAEERRAKAERAEFKKRKEALRPIQYYLKRAERAVNAFRRAQDLAAGYGCITCGTYDAEEWHAGHYRSVGACSSMRYDYKNIHLQCRQCNYFGAGKQQEYGDRLIARIGASEIERIKAAPKRYYWTREELQAIEAKAKADLRALLAQEKVEA